MRLLAILAIYTIILVVCLAALAKHEFSKLSAQVWEVQQAITPGGETTE